MENLSPCYDWSVVVAVITKKGKKRNNHVVTVLASRYEDVQWGLYLLLKKRGSRLITIKSARPIRIAFMYGNTEPGKVYRLADYPPEMPEDLNEDKFRVLDRIRAGAEQMDRPK